MILHLIVMLWWVSLVVTVPCIPLVALIGIADPPMMMVGCLRRRLTACVMVSIRCRLVSLLLLGGALMVTKTMLLRLMLSVVLAAKCRCLVPRPGLMRLLRLGLQTGSLLCLSCLIPFVLILM